jgi:hypothetical protein
MSTQQLNKFLNQFQNPHEWLLSLYQHEKEKMVDIFPERSHQVLFDNFRLNESELKSHLTFSISGFLIGIHPNNPNQENILNHMNTHTVYSTNEHNYTFQDIFNIFEMYND